MWFLRRLRYNDLRCDRLKVAADDDIYHLLENERAKILDFGIAKAWQEKGGSSGDDVFALGYILFTGKHPFDWKQVDKALAAGLSPVRHANMRRSEWRAIRPRWPSMPMHDWPMQAPAREAL